MKKRVITFSIIGILTLVIVLNYKLLFQHSWSTWNLPLSGRVVVIDPGHGGPDGGAVGGNIEEEDLTLKISQYLRDDLQQAGALVIMTREKDTDLAPPDQKDLRDRKVTDLQKRAKIVNQSDADLFISVHLNAIPSPRWKGAQTFYNPRSQENERLASFIQDSFRTQLGNTNRIALATNSLFLLNQSKIPSALVEVGFLSNSYERQLLKKKSYQKKLAGAIYNGILRNYTYEKTPPIYK